MPVRAACFGGWVVDGTKLPFRGRERMRFSGVKLTPGTPAASSFSCSHRAPSDAPYERTKCCRSCVDLIVMSAVRKSAKFIDKSLVPGAFHQFDHSTLALRCERISPGLLADLFRLDRHSVALQKTGEVVRLEFAGASPAES